MDSGRESGRGKGDDHEVSNVVHFPRDWIGPTEDLIPFGPAANRQAPAAASTTATPELPSASDFWGEHAAEIHSVLEDPGGATQTGDVAGASKRREALAGPVGEPETTSALRQPRSEPQPTRRPVARPRIAAVAGPSAIAAAAAGVIALAIGFLPGGGAHGPGASDEPSIGFLASTGRRLGASDGILSAVRHEREFVASVARPHVPRRPAGNKRRRSAHVAAAPASTSVAVGLTTPSTAAGSAAAASPSVTTSSGSGAGGTAASSSQGSGAATTSSGTTNSGSTGSGASSSSGSSSGPAGPGAPFGPGHLG